MACPTFKVTVSDVKAALAKAKAAAAKDGGRFSGDEKKGSLSFSGTKKIPIIGEITYTISSSYTVDDKTITITNDIKTNSPTLVTCKKVQDEMTDWFKG